MGYYRVLRDIRDSLPEDAMIIGEGANTMDIGRTVLNNYLPRHRLDAGSFGTMGIGAPFAIAAATVERDKRTVAVMGDSAFGFSGMEVEVACRYKLPITFVVINNNGIGGGPSQLGDMPPPNAYTPNARYERIVEAFGGVGFYVEKPEDVTPALEEAYASGKTAVVNVMINPRANRKPQQFGWLTR
jgi:2-hydroxyacyl-CoA lyase 1